MTEHADGPETDKAAWAGGDAADVAEAQRVEEQAEGGGSGTDGDHGPVVNDGTAADDGGEEPIETSTEADPLVELQAQLDERTADLQRVSAEFANYRRRMDRERTAGIEAARAGVLTELLAVVDDLDRARAHGDLEEGPLRAFADKMTALLASQGVEAFGEEGDPFDPNVHEAVQDESDGGEPVLGTVLRKGYRMGERTLRTAMVIVR
ncbi:nucleotide exchange factor GrpE [Dietzia sp. 179-F 9C3 NHS]|uniref:nucleotide exchange factor GrpE n=1 Tax=Dietzia sp. 179-F 9C3 NHS TaxID=3374295 RepID=UPI00387A3F8D